jgi:hypothetical protein
MKFPGLNPAGGVACPATRPAKHTRIPGRMNVKRLLFILLLTIAGIPVPRGHCALTNLLVNGNFNSVANGTPAGWSVWSWPNWTNAWVGSQNDANSIDGSPYVAVGNWNGGNYSEGLYQIATASAGVTYRLAVDSGAQAWWRPEGEMRLSFLDSNSVLLACSRRVTVNPNAWTNWDQGQGWSNFTLYATAPGNTTQAKVEFFMNGGTVGAWGGGTMWFDNASLTVFPTAALPAGFIKTSRCDLRDHAGTGDVMYLRGVNLGGWLYFEGWMCPGTINGLSNPLEQDVETNLIQRFGVAVKDSLIETYQSTWITNTDLDLVAAAGMNLVRVPFTYLTFQEEPQDPSVPLNQVEWKPDAVAFKHLDWLVNECARRRIYVVFDFHHPEGEPSADGLYGFTGYQDRFVEIWRRIATHFAGNPTVLGYDLVNESADAPNRDDVWNNAYQAIRSADPDHAVIAEYYSIAKTTSVMDIYGWQNVIASTHDYWTNGITVSNELAAARAAGPDNTVCPYYVGEFMDADDASPRIRYYSDAGALWSLWTLKTVNQMDWSMINAADNGASLSSDVPNLSTDSAATIQTKWARWQTHSPAVRFQPTCNRYSSPVAGDDIFGVAAGGTASFTTQTLLTNDTDLSQSAQLAVGTLPARTAHGSLTPTVNGYVYQQDSGFTGTDSFTCFTVDQRQHLPSAYPATVSLVPALLGIGFGGNGTTVISWPATADGFGLKTAAMLGPVAAWQTVTNIPVVTNGNNQVTLPMQGTQYFRLEK